MGLNHSPRIITENLVLNLDPYNFKSNKGRKSLINMDSWAAGQTGSVGIYGQNGDGNSRVNDTNPWGDTEVVWDVSNQDATSDADGGWNTSNFSVEPTKLYRYSVWVRRKTIGNGSFYLGVYGKNSVGTNEGVLNRSNSAINTNPYFRASGWWGSANQWYLVVGHVWPAGSGSGSVHVDSGIYDTSGTKITTTSDFVWQITNVLSVHRSYLYYSTDITTNQQFYDPRVDLCDGSEPSISELINNISNTIKNSVNLSETFKVKGNLPYNNAGYFTFANNQITQYIFNSSYSIPTDDITISCWFRSNFNQPNQTPYTYSVSGDNAFLFFTNSATQIAPHSFGSSYAVNVSDMTNKWCNFVRTRIKSSGYEEYYMNGELVGSRTYLAGTALTSGGYLIIGQEPDTNGGSFDAAQNLDGDFSLLQIYSKNLSASEIKLNFNALRGRFGI